MAMFKFTHGAGHFVLSEANGNRSRQRIVVGPNQNLLAGQVISKVTGSEAYVALDPDATDGSQTAAGILYDDVETDTEAKAAVSFERDCEVVLAKLVWPDGITELQKTGAITALSAKGVHARF